MINIFFVLSIVIKWVLKELYTFVIESSYLDDSDDDDDDLSRTPSVNQSISSLSSYIFIENVYENEIDELFEPLMTTGYRKQRVENYLNVVKSWTDAEFKENFRLSRTTAYHLISILRTLDFHIFEL